MRKLNSIFFRAGGYHANGYSFNDDQQGCYWTSTLDEEDTSSAYTCTFGEGLDDENVFFFDEYPGPRSLGYSIRPITE